MLRPQIGLSCGAVFSGVDQSVTTPSDLKSDNSDYSQDWLCILFGIYTFTYLRCLSAGGWHAESHITAEAAVIWTEGSIWWTLLTDEQNTKRYRRYWTGGLWFLTQQPRCRQLQTDVSYAHRHIKTLLCLCWCPNQQQRNDFWVIACGCKLWLESCLSKRTRRNEETAHYSTVTMPAGNVDF